MGPQVAQVGSKQTLLEDSHLCTAPFRFSTMSAFGARGMQTYGAGNIVGAGGFQTVSGGGMQTYGAGNIVGAGGFQTVSGGNFVGAGGGSAFGRRAAPAMQTYGTSRLS